MKVGVFDSGAGGLSVVKSLLEHKLFDEIIYYGDTARVPYGTKDRNTIIRYSLEALEFFNNFDIDLLITACNTVSAYALADMNAQSRYPVYGVIESGVMAVENSRISKDDEILIIATRATIGSKSYQKALENLGYKNITAIQTGLFVPMVEEGIFSGDILEATMKHYFKDIPEPKAIILGCTHFPLIGNSLQKYFVKEPLLIHSGEAIVEYLGAKYDISESEAIASNSARLKPSVPSQTEYDAKLKIFASDNVIGLRKIANEWLGENI